MMNDHQSFLACQAFQQTCWAIEAAYLRPSTMFKPRIKEYWAEDRDLSEPATGYVAVAGDVEGRGSTPEEAYTNFDLAWKEKPE